MYKRTVCLVQRQIDSKASRHQGIKAPDISVSVQQPTTRYKPPPHPDLIHKPLVFCTDRLRNPCPSSPAPRTHGVQLYHRSATEAKPSTRFAVLTVVSHRRLPTGVSWRHPKFPTGMARRDSRRGKQERTKPSGEIVDAPNPRFAGEPGLPVGLKSDAGDAPPTDLIDPRRGGFSIYFLFIGFLLFNSSGSPGLLFFLFSFFFFLSLTLYSSRFSHAAHRQHTS